MSCLHARQKVKNPKPNRTGKNQTTKNTNKKQKQNQQGRWSADQFMDNWKMQEEMITLYHLKNFYGNVKQKRNNKPQSAIQQLPAIPMLAMIQ